MIKIRNLNFRYSKKAKLVIKDLNLEIKEGTINTLLGLNGCGKTTLIKTIVGLLEPYDGEIVIDGTDLKNLSISKRAKIMSYVSQRNDNIDDFTVRDYLSFGMVNSTRFYEKPSQEKLSKIDEFAGALCITHLVDKKLGETSGGERQLISICSALLQDTKIILLDEPTSALDIVNQSLVLKNLRSICEREKKTIILTTHNPNHALYLNSIVYLMKDGCILDSGEAGEIISVERLKPVYGDSLVYSSEQDYKEVSFN